MRSILLLVLIGTVSGCTCHSTGANEVGVLTRKVNPFGEKGVQKEVYPSGVTYFFAPFVTDWNTFETKLQNLRMSKTPDENGIVDDVEFKTIDGNDISVDLTIAWRVDPEQAPVILQRVGESTSDVQERLVRPAARAYVRDSLNRLRSEDFYVADKRFAAAEESKTQLSKVLLPEGVIIEQVILGEHRFAPAYEEVIREKKIAEQNGEKLKSEASAAGEGAKRNLESARGKVNQQIAGARGELAQARLAADAQLVKAKNEGEALLAEAKSRAQGIEKESAAMGGAGGKTMVKLKIAEALMGKRIVLVPAGKGANLQTLDINQLITSIAARKAVTEK